MAKETECNRRLSENTKIHAVFSHLQPVQSSINMKEEFTIIEQLTGNGEVDKARVYVARKKSGEKCVLKIVSLDAAETKHITRAYRSTSRRGLQGNHSFLRYSCWTELNLLRNARQALLKQASPCFPFIYSSHVVECIDKIGFPNNNHSEPQLVYCIEYLSRITMRKWLKQQIIQSEHWDTDPARLGRQFHVLFFHIFAALNVLYNIGGFLHNDLHLDNILIVQSRETCQNFVYVIKGKYFVIPNNLGECLRQLPIICDFGTASNAHETQNVSFQEHFRSTHRCAFHQMQPLEKCFFTAFCDVLRILEDTFDELKAYLHTNLLELAFQPFTALKHNLLERGTNCRSSEQEFIHHLLDSMYQSSEMPASDFVLFNCDKILTDK